MNQYLVDVRQQLVVDQNFGMVDDVLETLIVTPQSGSDPANRTGAEQRPASAIHSEQDMNSIGQFAKSTWPDPGLVKSYGNRRSIPDKTPFGPRCTRAVPKCVDRLYFFTRVDPLSDTRAGFFDPG